MFTLKITTYCMNKRGFHYTLSFRRLKDSFLSLSSSILLSLSPPYLYPGTLPFLLEPLQVSNPSPFAYLSLTSLFYITTVQQETVVSWLRSSVLRITPWKTIFILLDSLTSKKIHYNSLILLFEHASRCAKTCIGFFNHLCPWWVFGFFVEFTWKLTRCYKSGFTSKPFSPL